MTELWYITQDGRDSAPLRKQLKQLICDWERLKSTPLQSTVAPLPVPPSFSSTVGPSSVPSSIPSTVAPSPVHASGELPKSFMITTERAKPWKAIKPVAARSSVPPSVPPTVAPSPDYASAELPMSTAQPSQPKSDAYASKTTPHMGQEVVESGSESEGPEPLIPPCKRCIARGVPCTATPNPNVSTCAECHHDKKGCIREGRVKGVSKKKPIMGTGRKPALELAVIPAGKGGEYAGAYIFYLILVWLTRICYQVSQTISKTNFRS